jgi:hypothetical protein
MVWRNGYGTAPKRRGHTVRCFSKGKRRTVRPMAFRGRTVPVRPGFRVDFKEKLGKKRGPYRPGFRNLETFPHFVQLRCNIM